MAGPNQGAKIGVGIIRNLTQAQLIDQNYVWPKNTLVIESDTSKQKWGDSATAYATLGYFGGSVFINNQSAAYTLALTDAGGLVSHVVGDNNARTFTIPANASVVFPIGTVIDFTNEINTVSIAVTSDTLKFGASGTGTRTLAVGGTARIVKLTSTIWRISGSAELT